MQKSQRHIPSLFSSLRVRLIILILITIIPIIGLIIYNGIKQTNAERLEAFNLARVLARNAATLYEQTILEARQIFFTLSQVPQLNQQDPEACSKILSDLLIQTGGSYSGFAAAKSNGEVFAGAPSLAQPVNFADCPWFQRLVQTRGFVVGEYSTGRISGKPVIVLGYPVMDRTGRLMTVLCAELDLEKQTLVKPALPDKTTLTVIDSDGTILISFPDPEKLVGQDMPEKSIIKALLAEKDGVIEEVGLGGIPRLFGFTSVGSGIEAIHISVGIPKQIALADVRRDMVYNLSWMGLVAVIALLGAWFLGNIFILSPVKRLIEVTKRLAEGDLTGRIGRSQGSGELGLLAYNFDQMAEALQHREAERQQAEKALQEQEHYYRSLIHNMHEDILVIDPLWRITDVNNTFLVTSGFKRENVIGRYCYEVSHDYKEPCFRYGEECLLGEVFATGVSRNCRHQHQRADGSKGWVDILYSPLMGADGKVTHVIGAMRDVTAMVQLERELKASEKRMRVVIESAPVGIKINQRGKLVYVNPALIEMFGYESADEMSGLPAENLYALEDRDFVRQKQREGFNDQRLTPYSELTGLKKNGDRFDVINYVGKFDFEGEPAIIAFVIDISSEKKLQIQLQQAQKMETIGRLAGGVAHDFNNILGVILGYTELALTEIREDDPLRLSLTEILKAGQSAASLVQQLLAFSRQQIIQPRVMDLNEAIVALKKMLDRLIGENIKLEMILEPALQNVKIDPGQMEQVVMNLIVNARDAMPQGGHLTIETANTDLDEAYFHTHGLENMSGSYVMLAISDTGVGMDEETRLQIFEPFFTTKEKGRGTGLGLATVYGIVKQNRGLIWAYSEPGLGATFKIYLPQVEKDAVSAEREKVSADHLRGSETVLIVEDDDSIRKVIRTILQRYGYNVLDAQDDEETVRISEEYQGPIHLMLTDVVLPRINGRALAELLQSLRPDLKVIFMSGYTDNAILYQGVLATGMNFIEKPFSPADLALKIRKVLDET